MQSTLADEVKGKFTILSKAHFTNMHLLIWIFLLLSLIEPSAETIYFEHLDGSRGLPQSPVLSICQDSLGFIWLGTYNGAYRYDGYAVKRYTYDPSDTNSISHNTVEDIITDKEGVLWFATADGLCRFDYDSEKFVRYRNALKDSTSLGYNQIRSLFEDSKGRLWVGTYGGGLDLCIDRKKGIFRHFKHDSSDPKSISDNKISQIYEDRHGNIWIATDGGLNLLQIDGRDSVSFRHFQHDSTDSRSISQNNIISICEDREGNLWIGTWEKGINRLEKGYDRLLKGDSDIPFIRYESPDFKYVTDIHEDRFGNLFFATKGGGIKQLKDREKIKYVNYLNNPVKTNTIINDMVLEIFEDRSGVIWVGSYGGVNIYDPYKKKFHIKQATPDDKNSFFFQNINSLLIDANKKGDIVWIGTQSRGLIRWDRRNGSIKVFDKTTGLLDNFITALYRDRSGRLWIATPGRVSRLDDEKKGKFVHYKNLKDVYSIYEDSRRAIWFGTYARGLYCVDLTDTSNLNPQKMKIVNYFNNSNDPASIGDNTVWAIFEDSDSILWFGTERGGLNRFDRKTGKFSRFFSNPSDTNTISNNFVRSIIEGRDGTLWIGTAYGLNKLTKADKNKDTLRFTRYKKEQGIKESGLPSNTINAIQEDKNGFLWISTDQGISRFDPKNGNCDNYNSEDGLQSEDFNVNVAGKGTAGTMYFGGNRGLNYFDPDSIRNNNFKPAVKITDFKISNESVPVGKMKDGRIILKQSIVKTDSIELSYNDDVISFEFAALHYGAPEFHKYAYIMDGFDKDWNFVGNRRYTNYTNLPSGRYVFRAIGSNSDGIWNDEGAKLYIKINRPFWEEWWFYTGIIILLAGCGIGFYKYKSSAHKRRQKELEEKVKERTAQLADLNKAESELSSVIRDGEVAIIKMLFEQAEKLIKTKNIQIALYNRKSNSLIFRSPEKENAAIMNIGKSEDNGKKSRIAHIIDTKTPLRLNTKEEIGKWKKDDLPGDDACSWMGIPMIAWKSVLGIIVVFDKEEENAYSEQQQQQLLSTLAHQAAITLDNAYLLDKIQKITKTYPSIYNLSKDRKAVIQNIVNIASEVMESDVTVLYTYNRRTGLCAWPPVTSGEIFNPQYMQTPIDANDAPYRIIRNGKNIYSADSLKDPVLHPEKLQPREGIPARFLDREKIRSSAAVLLKAAEEVVGVIFFNYRSDHEFDKNEIRIIELCSTYVATAIQTVFHFYEKEKTDAATTMETITGRVAHKLKNKFASMRLFIEGVLNNYSLERNANQRLTEAISILDQSTIIIKNLLELSKLKIHNKKTIRIESLIKEVQKELQPELDLRNIKFKTSFSPDLPEMYLDPDQIKLVFSNLADNSIAFVKEGGKISVSVRRERDTVFIEWADTGPGIPSQYHNQLFHLGFTTRNDGFGLGLFHSRAIIEEYGGSITLDTTYTKGAKFVIQLPIHH